MSQQQWSPSDGELRAFAAKLGEFRTTLNSGEQRILDALLLSARGDVQGYGFDAALVERFLAYWTEGPAAIHGGAEDDPSGRVRDYQRATRAGVDPFGQTP